MLEAVPVDPLLGVTLAGAYEVLRPLGRGGMGALYVARQTRLERTVAVKVLHPSFADHELALSRFFREAQAMARVRSVHVAQVLDALRLPDGRPCLVLEHLHGEDLQAHLKKGPMSPEDVLRLGVELCRGLEAVHAAGVVHRDLKPSNVFLDESGVAKLLDFGVAHLEGEDALTRSGTVVGTPTYMAPEQVRGSADVDGRADVYGLGAVLYRALTGKPPYGTGPATVVLSSVLEGPPEPPSALRPDLPLDVETWVLRAMSRDPRTRFQSPTEMREEALRLIRKRRPEPTPTTGRRVQTALLAGGALGAAGAAAAQAREWPAGIGWGLGAMVAVLLLVRWLRPPSADPDAVRHSVKAVHASLRMGAYAYALLMLASATLRPIEGLSALLAACVLALVAGLAQRSRSKWLSPSRETSSAKGSSQSTEPASESRPPMHRTASLPSAT